MRKSIQILSLVGTLSLLGACGAVDSTTSDLVLDESSDGKADAYTTNLPFDIISVDLGSKGTSESRWLVTSKAGFEKTFKTKAPTDVKWGSEWVYIYSAGTKNTGGYNALVSQITFSKKGNVLRFYDLLETPGPDCFVTYALTKPYVAVKFKKQGYDKLAYKHSTEERVCNPCATVKCAAGTHCEVVEVQCITAPCPPIAQCVADDPCSLVDCGDGMTCENVGGSAECVPLSACAAVRCAAGTICIEKEPGVAACVTPKTCGGIAGIACPGALECVDNPADSCDPANGGADCGGICLCTLLAKCAAGYHFDRDPAVCSCVLN